MNQIKTTKFATDKFPTKDQFLNSPLSCGDPNNRDHPYSSVSSGERYLGCRIDRRSSRVGTSEDSERWRCSLRPPVPVRGDRRVPLKTRGNRKLMKSKRTCTEVGDGGVKMLRQKYDDNGRKI